MALRRCEGTAAWTKRGAQINGIIRAFSQIQVNQGQGFSKLLASFSGQNEGEPAPCPDSMLGWRGVAKLEQDRQIRLGFFGLVGMEEEIGGVVQKNEVLRVLGDGLTIERLSPCDQTNSRVTACLRVDAQLGRNFGAGRAASASASSRLPVRAKCAASAIQVSGVSGARATP